MPQFPTRARNRQLLNAFFQQDVPNEEGGGDQIDFTTGQKNILREQLKGASGSQQDLEQFFLGLDSDNPLFESFAFSREARNTRRRVGLRQGFESTILTGPQTGLPGAIAPAGGVAQDEFPLPDDGIPGPIIDPPPVGLPPGFAPIPISGGTPEELPPFPLPPGVVESPGGDGGPQFESGVGNTGGFELTNPTRTRNLRRLQL